MRRDSRQKSIPPKKVKKYTAKNFSGGETGEGLKTKNRGVGAISNFGVLGRSRMGGERKGYRRPQIFLSHQLRKKREKKPKDANCSCSNKKMSTLFFGRPNGFLHFLGAAAAVREEEQFFFRLLWLEQKESGVFQGLLRSFLYLLRLCAHFPNVAPPSFCVSFHLPTPPPPKSVQDTKHSRGPRNTIGLLFFSRGQITRKSGENGEAYLSLSLA